VHAAQKPGAADAVGVVSCVGRRVLELARESDCSVYDCEFVALAMPLGTNSSRWTENCSRRLRSTRFSSFVDDRRALAARIERCGNEVGIHVRGDDAKRFARELHDVGRVLQQGRAAGEIAGAWDRGILLLAAVAAFSALMSLLVGGARSGR